MSDPLEGGLAQAAERVLRTADPWEKTALSRAAAAAWFAARERGEAPAIGSATPPGFPARPERPELLDPRKVPRRRTGTRAGRAALLHAIAHIELNAVDLHWDIVARFAGERLPLGFFDDWVRAADEESKHFGLLSARLEAHDTPYGALPRQPRRT